MFFLSFFLFCEEQMNTVSRRSAAATHCTCNTYWVEISEEFIYVVEWSIISTGFLPPIFHEHAVLWLLSMSMLLLLLLSTLSKSMGYASRIWGGGDGEWETLWKHEIHINIYSQINVLNCFACCCCCCCCWFLLGKKILINLLVMWCEDDKI